MNLKILYEDNHLIAVDKPAGMLTQEDYTREKSILTFTKEYIKAKYSKPGNVFLGMVHRLDRSVSGVVVFARTSKGASRLNEQFRERRVLKIYAAAVENQREFPAGGWIHLKSSLVRMHDVTGEADDEADGRESSLNYKIISRSPGRALVAVELITGRKHQIRAQLSGGGMPVAGDEKYGAAAASAGGYIALHSYMIGFKHPTEEKIVIIKSEIPERIITASRAGVDAVKKIETESILIAEHKLHGRGDHKPDSV
jgi:23S rRNA pseudouridine1911/1915/1917 synthase